MRGQSRLNPTWVASMTATDISLNGSLPAHGPILYDVIFICVYTCTCLFYMANGLNKELLNLNLNVRKYSFKGDLKFFPRP